MVRSTRIALFVFFLLWNLPPATGWGATTYTWNAAGGPWTNSVSWTPNRTTPATDDILVFPAMGGVAISGIPTQTVGQVIFAPGAYYFFHGASPGAMLTIAGGTGLDLDLPATGDDRADL